MNASVRNILVALAFVAGLGTLVYTSMPSLEAQCEVCMEFRGEMVCRSAAAATEEEAKIAAQESTCGGNTSGMSDAIRCRNATPERVTCTQL